MSVDEPDEIHIDEYDEAEELAYKEQQLKLKQSVLEKVKHPTNKMIVHPTNKNPMDSPFSSWFGHIGVLPRGEDWPKIQKISPFPLCQINTAELPYTLPQLKGIAMICVWLVCAESRWERGSCNGNGWLLRCYSSLSDLVPTTYFYPRLKKKDSPSTFFSRLLDFTHWTDYVPPCSITWELADDYPYPPYVKNLLTDEEYSIYDSLYFCCDDPMSVENVDVSKVGGWPTVIEFEPFGQFKHSPFLDFILQIRSCPELSWGWFTPNDERSFGFFAHSRLSDDWLFDRHSWLR